MMTKRRVQLTLLLGLLLPFLFGATGDKAWEQQQATYLKASRQEWNHRIVKWREVAAWTFDDGRMPADFHPFSGTWIVADGRLQAADGKPDRNRTLGIANCRWPAFRLQFDVTLEPREGARPDRIGDIGIALNADPKTGSFAEGYAFIAAQYMGQATVFYRRNVPYARTEWSPIEPGRRHEVMVEVVKPHLRLWVDGRVLLEGWERSGSKHSDFSDFMDMDPARVITLHTYDSVMSVDNLRILVPATP